MPKDDFFKKKVAALLHDPPSKPWIISGELNWLGGHEEHAKSLARDLFGEEIASLIEDKDVKESDKLAASFDRWILSFLMGGDYEHRAFVTKDVKLFNLFYREKPYEAPLQPPPKDLLQYRGQLSKFVENINTIHEQVLDKGGWHLAYNTFYALYEYLWCRYFGTPGPADTRIPTHTVFDHTYATASTLNMVGNEKLDGYMVSIDLGGVQNFISASRKLRDLWASSWLTSSFAWSVVLPFIEAFGPDILVLPTARGNPFFYHTLTCMLNARGVGKTPDDIRKAAELAGYEIGLGYPRHAVVPATITLILPSTRSYPEDAYLTADGKELELTDAKKIAEFINELYLSKWRRLVESVLDTISVIPDLISVFDKIALNNSPPLPLRVAIAEIRSDISSKEAYLAYHKAFRQVSRTLREAGSLKVSPSVALDLTKYTTNYQQHPFAAGELRFYVCSVCGEVPAVPKSLEVARGINSIVNERNLITVEEIRGRPAGERLCPYCLIKRLSTTRKVFPRILEGLLRKHRLGGLPRFPSVSSIAAINFKKTILDAIMKRREDILPLLRQVIKSGEDINDLPASQVAYYIPEQELLERVRRDFEDPELKVLLGKLAIGDAEDLFLVGEQRAVVSRLARAARKVLNSEPALNTYYAMIKGDGDDVGKVVSGDIGDVKAISSFNNLFGYLSNLTPNEDLGKILYMIGDNRLEEAAQLLSKGLHREVEAREIHELFVLLKKSLEEESDAKDKWIKKLLVSPAYHASLSRALMNLATKTSKEISEREGFVVYSGGDDVLAVSPTDAAWDATLKARIAFGGEPYMGFSKQSYTEKDTFVPSLGDLGQSFSVTYAHYRYPLSRVLKEAVDSLEDEAKEVEWLEHNSAWLKKDSALVTYLPRGGNPIQARLPFRIKCEQIGGHIKEIIYVVESIDKGLISVSLIKDLDEWIIRIKTAHSTAAIETAEKMIEYVVDRNAARESSSLNKNKVKEILVKGLNYTWCYGYETPEKRRRSFDERLLINELGKALQAELGARRGVES